MSQARDFADSFSAVSTGRRNMIINGAMQHWQRGTAALAGTNYLADRFKVNETSDGAITQERDTDAPNGFAYSLEVNVTTADSSESATDIVNIAHSIEGQDLQSLKYGTTDASAITISFWVKSNKTGTYCFHITKYDQTRLTYVKEYTIDSADTWEKKVITVEPDSNVTASGGAIDNNNGAGFELNWQLMVGTNYDDATDGSWSTNANHLGTSNQVNWMDSTSNNFYLTGVQLEVGNSASPFEHRSYGEELALCQRYYLQTGNAGPTMWNFDGTTMAVAISYTFPVPMRATPSVSGLGADGKVLHKDSFSAYKSSISSGANWSFTSGWYADAEL